MPPASFARFRDLILATDPDAVAGPDRIPAGFLLASAGRVSAHYIPFDHVNLRARVVVVGISPGFVQWKNAVREARRQLALGMPDHEVLRAAKYTGAFSGAIRPNLVALLDHIGLQHWLGIASCAGLFDTDAHLMHVTGALRQPVFVDGANYNGANPNMLTTSLLQAQLLEYFGQEAAQLAHAVFVPLGPKVGLALSWLAQRGIIDEKRILHGLPHPSGANAERIAYFLGRKEMHSLSSRTNGARIDADRLALREKMTDLGMPPLP
ncbi:hypothetical protein AB595_08500 [Massilia sp. WF1]|uniref:hypothetical protein n=1 Tax=unclassified Massilia TaxID=2609279 RepID=UPI000649D8F4|nr:MULTISPECIES: hypothetical protein [unclassified Massilia]ALK96109.1 hypothetical protein AM586_07270 [Massilia sp. WG5]KLU37308.1 hypothetical protein AB595_08500 [Massilia sp. WF1]